MLPTIAAPAMASVVPSTSSRAVRCRQPAGLPAMCRPLPASPRLPAVRAHKEHSSSGSPSPSPNNTVSARRTPSANLDEDAPFFEPLIRTLVLGVSAGGLVELLHVLDAAGQASRAHGGFSMLPFLIPQAYQALSPWYFIDHAVAIGVWVLLYLVEARTINTILDQHPKDPLQAANTIRSTMTLPKRMLPLSLTAARRAVVKFMTGFNPAAATVASSAQPSAFMPGDAAREAARRAAARGGSSYGGASTSVLERPPVKEPEQQEGSNSDVDVDTPSPSPAPEAAPAPAPPKSRSAALRGPTSPAPAVVPNIGTSPNSPAAIPTSAPEEKRAREIRERKAYLKDMWYCVGISEELKDQPKEVQILGRTVTIFREEETGKVRCMENLCPHRGAPLGQGWTKKVGDHTCVVCPYHAWAFDGEGKLRDVPASTKGQLPKRPMLDTYPVEEKGGFIWLYFGSSSMPAEERVPIPHIPELEDPNWRAVYAEMEFDAPHWSTYDNALDMAHIHYVHNSSFGNPDKPEILDMHMERDTFGIKGSFKIHNKPVNKLWEWTRVPYVPVTVQGFLPMTSAVRIQLAGGIQMITFVNTVPIDENRSINRFCLIRNFATSPLADGFVKNQMFTILGEDKEMVEKVNPDDMPVEYSLEADLPQVAFRKLRQEWVNMGYAVDPETTVGHKGSLRTDKQ